MIIQKNQITRLNPNQQAWLLVKLSDKTTLPQFYKNNNSPKFTWLYETTLLDEVKKEGPLLVNLNNTTLLESFCQKPDQWTAFLLYTSTKTTEVQLLEHLRKLLIVRLNDEDTGVLNYFDSKVASFFFKMPEQQLSNWLGPIDMISWWGGDFIAVESNQQQLYCATNPLPLSERIELEEKPKLTSEQELLLQQCQEQQYIWQWSTSVNIPFIKAWQCYQEGLQLSFLEDNLEEYIKLRADNVDKVFPIDYSQNLTAPQKLQLLKEYWTEERV